MDLVHRFAVLFAGRTDAHGTDSGGCVRGAVTGATYHAHLVGEEAIGIYPLVDGHVVWGCTDIDLGFERSLPMARNLRRALALLGITSWIERSRSKGWHVFVFAAGWLPAEHMRNALLFAHGVAGVPAKEVNPKQINGVELGNYLRLPYPGAWSEKQELDPREPGMAGGSDRGGGVLVLEEVEPERRARGAGPLYRDERSGRSGIGAPYRRGGNAASSQAGQDNAVRGEHELPVAGASDCGRCGAHVRTLAMDARTARGQDSPAPRRVVVDATSLAPYCVACFVELAWSARNEPEVIARVATMYVPPPPPKPVPISEYRGHLGDLTTQLGGLAYTIFTEGPLEGKDRSGTLQRFAYLCRDDGLGPSEAHTLLVDADSRWGKYRSHPNGERELRKIIERAYG